MICMSLYKINLTIRRDRSPEAGSILCTYAPYQCTYGCYYNSKLGWSRYTDIYTHTHTDNKYNILDYES